MTLRAQRGSPLHRALWQMREDPWLQLLAITSLTVALVIVGAYLTLCLNLDRAAARFFTGGSLVVVLTPDLPPGTGEELAQEMAAMPGVGRAEYVPKARALEKFRRQLGSQQGILEGLAHNPLPDTVEVYLAPLAPLPGEMAHYLEGLPGVAEVVTGQPWLERLENTTRGIRQLAVTLGALLLLGVVLLVTNITRLAAHARRRSLGVLDLLGATRTFVLLPFLLEAVIQGLGAAGLATLALEAILGLLASPQVLPLSLDLEALLRLPPAVPGYLAAVAVFSGLLGGFLGVGRAIRPWREL
ncbi:MAG: permease-like cell division protein FtsX [Deltaproteobacteria bacterium]|nr:permease-like cell division protein FtsX [Deltaproteobacteria bacterium]